MAMRDQSGALFEPRQGRVWPRPRSDEISPGSRPQADAPKLVDTAPSSYSVTAQQTNQTHSSKNHREPSPHPRFAG